MLFWLCLIVLIVGIGLVVVGKMEWFYTRNENKLRKFLYQNDDTIEYSGWATIAISGIIMTIMIIVFTYNYIGVNAQVEKAKELIIPELSEPPVRTLGATIPENESHIFR